MNKKNVIVGIIVLVLLGITSLLIYTSKAFYEVSDSFNFINSRYYEDIVTDFNYTGTAQTFTAAEEGYYKIEAWGGASGISEHNTNGYGKGAYTSGIINLSKDELLYIYSSAGGGGGYSLQGGRGHSAGASMEIRLEPGLNTDSYSLRSRIMVAAGAGGVAGDTAYNQGGHSYAGGLIGTSGDRYPGHAEVPISYGRGGSQISPGTNGINIYDATGTSTTPGFGIASTAENYSTRIGSGGGGAGYYGGGSGGGTQGGGSGQGGGGGSSYISGYAGVNSVLETGGTDLAPIHSYDTIHYSGKYFINPIMKAGYEEMPNPQGGTMVGNSESGKLRITYLGNISLEKTNTTLNNVRYIKDCVNGTSANIGDYWVEIQAIANGVNVAKAKPVTGSVAQNNGFPYSRITDGDITSSNYSASSVYGLQCVTVDLGQTYNLDELAVWHYYADGRSSYHNYLSVGSANVSGITSLSTVLINNQTVMDTSQGQRFTAWD